MYIQIITKDGSAVRPYKRYWDKCSATPFLVHREGRKFITYDDPKSIAIKAWWARNHGMGGVKLMDAHGDHEGVLAQTVRTQLLQLDPTRIDVNVETNRELVG